MTDSKTELRAFKQREAVALTLGCAVLLLMCSPLFLAAYVIMHFIRKWW